MQKRVESFGRRASQARFRRRHAVFTWQIRSVFVLIALLSIIGCDSLFTKPPEAGDDFETPFEGMSFDLNATFAQGDEAFDPVHLQLHHGLVVFHDDEAGQRIAL